MKKLIAALAALSILATPAYGATYTFVTNAPTAETGWSYSAGTATASNVIGKRLYSTTQPIVAGKVYRYTYTVSGRTAGSVQPYVGSIRMGSSGADVTSPSLAGTTAIADNFTTSLGTTGQIAPGASVDPVGAFRMFCTGGQVQGDDPLLLPNSPGASHLHQFFGNTGANAKSTYKSLRTSGGTTCGSDSAHPINRAAYWFPAMFDGKGGIIKPSAINVYYKRYPTGSQGCTQSNTDLSPVGTCVSLPNGLRFIWGYNMTTMTASPDVYWNCRQSQSNGGGDAGPSVGGITFATLQALRTAGACPSGMEITVFASAPHCWDGTRLDSADHRAHVHRGLASNGKFHLPCPNTHPYYFPQIDLQIDFDVDANLNNWRLSSDEQMGMGVVAGETFHTDYFEAWSPAYKAAWQTGCIDALKSCSGGTAGDLTTIIGGNNLGGRSVRLPMNRRGWGVKRSVNGTYSGELVAPASGEFGLYSPDGFTGSVTSFSIVDVTSGGKGPVTTHHSS